ncbi:hypothetical protein [Herbaspirillum sp. RV1423]|uniref:hypothetical protein n=1 Tax=Herbaspirillum sp. RV1423 TaxID=1443993 RepID=UPI0004B63D9E|nr:hypothetical protein [Herbaspirillum sp. RV1423]
MWSTTHPLFKQFRAISGESCCNSEFLRRHARRLVREGRSGQPSKALPVLRRIIDAGVMPELGVADLYAVRDTLQLKHVLHTLARELGFAGWETCKHDIDSRGMEVLDRYRLEQGQFGDFRQNWFADQETARAWQQQNGGYLVAYGRQAVAILAD